MPLLRVAALALLQLLALSAAYASGDTAVLLSQSNLQLHNTQARHGLYSDAALAGKHADKTTLVAGVKTALPGQSYAQVRACRLVPGKPFAIMFAAELQQASLPPSPALCPAA